MADLAYYLAKIAPEHATKPKFMATVTALLQPLVDIQTFFESMLRLFDLDTATGVQLDQIGLWIGIGRRVNVPITDLYFSFDIDGLGFDQGIWFQDFDPTSDVVELDDDTYRSLLRAKVLLNKWDGSKAQLYDVLDAMFKDTPGITISITDNMDMTMMITLGGDQPSAALLAVFTTNVLPFAPLGVELTVTTPW
jgi:hypothetical protein